MTTSRTSAEPTYVSSLARSIHGSSDEALVQCDRCGRGSSGSTTSPGVDLQRHGVALLVVRDVVRDVVRPDGAVVPLVVVLAVGVDHAGTAGRAAAGGPR
jgi:hypothetical protein